MLSVLVFSGWLITGRVPAIAYANDHEFALLAALVIVSLVGLIEMYLVLRFTHLLARIPRLGRHLAGLLKPSEKEWAQRLAHASWPYLGLIAIIGLPAGGGMWVALGLAVKIGLNAPRAIITFALANAAWFTAYRAAIPEQLTWYIAGLLALVALMTITANHVRTNRTQTATIA